MGAEGMISYCFNYIVTISHSADNCFEHRHFHSLEIATYISVASKEFEMFDDIEKYGEDYIATYQNKYLNDCEEFGGDTSIENIGEVMYAALEKILENTGLSLERFEIGETPLRKYVITHRI